MTLTSPSLSIPLFFTSVSKKEIASLHESKNVDSLATVRGYMSAQRRFEGAPRGRGSRPKAVRVRSKGGCVNLELHFDQQGPDLNVPAVDYLEGVAFFGFEQN